MERRLAESCHLGIDDRHVDRSDGWIAAADCDQRHRPFSRL
jgi:hypothetical protein